jgi:Ca2+-binding RTX toxin-like protein
MALIIGGLGNDILFGTSGDDSFWGYAGADSMTGGAGNDTYYVDDPGDTVHEAPGGGHDMIVSHIPLSSATPNVEDYAFATGAPVVFVGNALDNRIQGGSGDDVIAGYGGQDQINGYDGNDALLGWTGKDALYGDNGSDVLNGLGDDDVLNGGAGADTMYGGDGNDTFWVDNIGDRVVETSSGGSADAVISAVALTTAYDNIERYQFAVGTAVHFTGGSTGEEINGGSGADVIHGGGGRDSITGNDGNDRLYLDSGAGGVFGGNGDDQVYGGAGNDTLAGGPGSDVMSGGAGNDIYWVVDTADRIVEAVGGGDDEVRSYISIGALAANVEEVLLVGSGNLNATGNGLDNRLYGNEEDNALNGGAGNDYLYGNAGNDSLRGGAGSDSFGFYLGSHAPTGGGLSGNTDTIADFDRSTDRLDFHDVGDKNGDHVLNLADLLLDVSSVLDHGAGHDVTVGFTNGAAITFTGAGTGAAHSLEDLVASPSQITVA